MKTDVFFLDESNRCGERECAGEEDGFAVADAEGFAACEPVIEALRQVAEEDFGVAIERRRCDLSGEPGSAVALHALAEEGHAVGGHGEADGVRVAAESGEER